MHDHAYGHAYGHGPERRHDEQALAQQGRDASRRLGGALGINFVFLVAEVVGGLVTGSLALLADCSDTAHWQACLLEPQTLLRERFDIEHTTLQLDPPGHAGDERKV